MKISKLAYLLPLAILLLPTVAATTPTTSGGGSYTTTFKATSTKTAGENTIIHANASFTATGTFVGTCKGTDTVEMHSGSQTFQGSCTFKGSVGQKTGTAFFRFNALIDSNSFRGNFNVSHGTDGLAGFHAQGTFGPTTYTVSFHFD